MWEVLEVRKGNEMEFFFERLGGVSFVDILIIIWGYMFWMFGF